MQEVYKKAREYAGFLRKSLLICVNLHCRRHPCFVQIVSMT